MSNVDVQKTLTGFITKKLPSQADILGQQMVMKDLEILQLKKANSDLGKQIVALDLRLMRGGM